MDALKAGRLMEDAALEFDRASGVEDVSLLKERGHDHWEEALKSWEAMPEGLEQSNVAAGGLNANKNDNDAIYRGLHGNQTPGFMVLGMHRSGTSMLSGLLVKGFGYETGGPLIGAAVSFGASFVYCVFSTLWFLTFHICSYIVSLIALLWQYQTHNTNKQQQTHSQ